MDHKHFDTLTRALSEAGTRRGLLGILATLPVLGGLFAPIDSDEVDAKGRRKRRKKSHKHGKGRHKGKHKKKKCKPKSKTTTCAGKCGSVKNNCKKTVDCGSCACDPPCRECFVCNESTGVCEPDPNQQGDACGEPGQVCQANGDCACSSAPDTCPANATCAGDGPSCACDFAVCDGTCCALGQLCCTDTCVTGDCCTNAQCTSDPTTPICDASHVCVGCAASSECPADQICLSDGSCQACTVTCTGTPAACGAALQTAMNGGATVYVCPGTYRGGFTLSTGVTVIGAGEGGNAASDTILDGNNAMRVVDIPVGTGPVELRRLRITGGASSSFGAGINHIGTTLRMSDCTVTGNAATSGGGGFRVGGGRTLDLTRCTVRANHASSGGGIVTDGTTTLTDCRVEANSAHNVGGGIFVNGGLTTLAGTTEVRDNEVDLSAGGIFVQFGTLEIAETCRVTANTAPTGNGGGIFNNVGTVTLHGADPSPIVVDNCVENCVGNVPKCAAGGSCPP